MEIIARVAESDDDIDSGMPEQAESDPKGTLRCKREVRWKPPEFRDFVLRNLGTRRNAKFCAKFGCLWQNLGEI